MTIPVHLETNDRGTIAFAFDYPGACGWGASTAEAMDRLRADIRFTIEWMRGHGLQGPGDRPDAVGKLAGELVIEERVPSTGNPLECDSEGLFELDRHPVDREALDRTRRSLHASRSDVLALTRELDEAILDHRLVSDRRTLREILEHVALAEHWYLTRVATAVSLPDTYRAYPTGTFERLEATREDVWRVLDRFETAAPIDADPHRVDGEAWTKRKVLRRLVWHELLHYKQLVTLVPKMVDGTGT